MWERDLRLLLQNMAKRIGSSVAVTLRVRRAADADAIENDQERAH